MLDLYKRLEAEGKIGQNDEHGRPRPRQEFPKWIETGQRDEKGIAVRALVHSAREELAVQAVGVETTAPDDPVVAERNRLAKEVQELRDKLAAIAIGSAAKSPAVPEELSKSVGGEVKKEVVK